MLANTFIKIRRCITKKEGDIIGRIVVVSFIIGINNYWGRKKWFITIGLGITYMLAEYGTFSAANMISFGKINLPEFIMIPMGAGISLLGMGMGTGFKYWVHFRGDNNG